MYSLISTAQHTLKSRIRCFITKLSRTPNRIKSILIKACPPLLFIYRGKISSNISGGCSPSRLTEQQKQLLIALFTTFLNFLFTRYIIKLNKDTITVTVKQVIPYMAKLNITLSISHLLNGSTLFTVPTKYQPKKFPIFN